MQIPADLYIYIYVEKLEGAFHGLPLYSRINFATKFLLASLDDRRYRRMSNPRRSYDKVFGPCQRPRKKSNEVIHLRHLLTENCQPRPRPVLTDREDLAGE